MKKDKLLEEYKEMKVSNPQEFLGGEQEYVPYDTQYSTAQSTNSGTTPTTDYVDDITTDYAWVNEPDKTRVNNNNLPFLP